MSDKNDLTPPPPFKQDMNNPSPQFIQQRREASVNKKLAIKRMEELTKNSEWNLIEQIMQEIEAYYLLRNEKQPSLLKMIELTKEEIAERYSQPDQLELKELLLAALPSNATISQWRKRRNWDDAVWSKAKVGSTGLFSHEKRANVIHALYDYAIKGSTPAAKIWLTLSGDYNEKVDAKNEILDQFKEINNILHNPKK